MRKIIMTNLHDVAVKSKAKKLAAYLDGTYTEGDDDLAVSAGGMSIFQAIINRDYEAMEAIIKMGTDLNGFCELDGSYKGCTPLGIACANLDGKAVKILIDGGADVSYKNSEGRTAISFCMAGGMYMGDIIKNKDAQKIIKSLFDAGIDKDGFVDDDSNTMLNYACKSTFGGELKPIIINELLKLGVEINTVNLFGETPLMHVCKGDINTMENIQISMLEYGADVTAKDKNGNTVLHYAAMNSNNSGAKIMADMLFEFGKVDVNAVNNEEKTAMDIATENNNEPLVKLLLNKM